jgi:ABC-type amino acid transport substrate-binding protein
VCEQVIARGKIRCVYIPYPGACIKDEKSKKLSGIFVDIIEQIGRNLDLKIEWGDQVDWTTATKGLENGRYDLVVSPMWAAAGKIKNADFTRPLYYSPLCVVARPEDDKYIYTDEINFPRVKIGTIEDENSQFLASRDFPLATIVKLEKTSDILQVIDNVTTKKTDIALVEPYVVWTYLSTHPGAVQNFSAGRPLAMMGDSMMFKHGQSDFKELLDNAIAELQNTGELDQIIDKYEPQRGLYYRLAPQYNLPEIAEKLRHRKGAMKEGPPVSDASRLDVTNADLTKNDKSAAGANTSANPSDKGAATKTEPEAQKPSNAAEPGKTDSNKQDAGKTDRTKQDNTKQDATKSDSSKPPDATKTDNSKQGTADSDKTKQDAAKSDSTKSDAKPK